MNISAFTDAVNKQYSYAFADSRELGRNCTPADPALSRMHSSVFVRSRARSKSAYPAFFLLLLVWPTTVFARLNLALHSKRIEACLAL